MPYRAPQLSHAPTERPRRWVGATVAAVALAGVGLVGVLSLRRAEPAAVPVPREEPPPWPSQARARTAHRDADGTQQVLFGLLRFTVTRSGQVAVAPARFDATVIAAVPVTTGWVFVAADGSVAASETFLGSPRAVGRFPCAFRVARDSIGRAVLIGEDGSLWTTDGSSNGLTRHRLPAEVRAATFVDATHGAAVLRDGRVMLTDSAGQRWEGFDIGRDVAWAVVPGVGGVTFETTGGSKSHRWGLGARTAVEVDQRVGQAPLPREVEDRLRAFINRPYERFEAAGSAARCQHAGAAQEEPAREEPRRYVCRSEQPVAPLTALPMLRRRNVEARDLVAGTEAGPVRTMFWRPRGGAAQETLVRVGWRGADELGSFTGATSPSGLGLGLRSLVSDRGGPLTVSAFTRRGALVLLRDGGTPTLAWGTPERPFVQVHDDFVEQDLPGMRSFFVASPDGGVTTVWSRPLYDAATETWSRGYVARHQQVGVALVIDVQGAVRERRGFVSDDVALQMIARTTGSVGPVLHGAGEPPRWGLLPVEGGDAKGLPSVRWADIAACDAPGVPGAAMDVPYPPIGLDGWTAPGEVGAVSRAELELTADGRVCTRAVSIAGRRLTATAGDTFEGAMRCQPARR